MNAPLMTDLQLQAPEPLLPEATKPTAYPVHRLPPLMRDAALAIAEHVQAPLALASQCVLGAVTHLAQTRVNAPHLHDPNGMPCSLNMLTLALSADRKDSCHALAGKPITEKEKEVRDHYRRACAEIMAEADHFKGKAREAFLAENPLSADPRTQYGGDATWEPIVGDFVRGKAAPRKAGNCWEGHRSRLTPGRRPSAACAWPLIPDTSSAPVRAVMPKVLARPTTAA